jgi:predicted transcriptional regulator
MADEHILISLEPRHADNILAGSKRVELRRRAMNISPGAIVWIYAKLPTGSIVGHAKVCKIHRSSPATLWRHYGSVSGLSKQEFFDYFGETEKGVALILEDSTKLQSSLSLEALREVDRAFQPPQFFARLTSQHPLHGAVLSSVSMASEEVQ